MFLFPCFQGPRRSERDRTSTTQFITGEGTGANIKTPKKGAQTGKNSAGKGGNGKGKEKTGKSKKSKEKDDTSDDSSDDERVSVAESLAWLQELKSVDKLIFGASKVKDLLEEEDPEDPLLASLSKHKLDLKGKPVSLNFYDRHPWLIGHLSFFFFSEVYVASVCFVDSSFQQSDCAPR
jgi:hypothetical protein